MSLKIHFNNVNICFSCFYSWLYFWALSQDWQGITFPYYQLISLVLRQYCIQHCISFSWGSLREELWRGLMRWSPLNSEDYNNTNSGLKWVIFIVNSEIYDKNLSWSVFWDIILGAHSGWPLSIWAWKRRCKLSLKLHMNSVQNLLLTTLPSLLTITCKVSSPF